MVKVKPVQNGRTSRMSFSRINEVIGMPNLIEIQKNSYNWYIWGACPDGNRQIPARDSRCNPRSRQCRGTDVYKRQVRLIKESRKNCICNNKRER